MENQTISNPEMLPQPIPTPPATTPPKKSYLPLILAAIVILFISILGGITLGKYLYGPQTAIPIPTLTLKPTKVPTITSDLTLNWKTYGTKDASFSYPSNWKVEEKTIEDTLTVLIKKGDGDSIYNTTIYLGSPFIFSTSGAIDANEPEGGKIGNVSFTFLGKNYSADIVELEKYKSGKPLNEKYYRFQVNLEEISPIAAITVQFLNPSDKDTINQILSTFQFLD